MRLSYSGRNANAVTADCARGVDDYRIAGCVTVFDAEIVLSPVDVEIWKDQRFRIMRQIMCVISSPSSSKTSCATVCFCTLPLIRGGIRKSLVGSRAPRAAVRSV